MLGRDVLVREGLRLNTRQLQEPPGRGGDARLGRALSEHLRQPVQGLVHAQAELARVGPHLMQQGIDDALGVGEQREQHVLGLDALVVARHGLAVGFLQRGLRLHRQSIQIHVDRTSWYIGAVIPYIA